MYSRNFSGVLGRFINRTKHVMNDPQCSRDDQWCSLKAAVPPPYRPSEGKVISTKAAGKGREKEAGDEE